MRVWRLRRYLRYGLVFGIGLLLIFFWLQFGVYVVPSGEGSLVPEVLPGDRLLYDRFCFYHRGLEFFWHGDGVGVFRYDLVVYRRWFHGVLFRRVGRVLGLSGDEVWVERGGVRVGGRWYRYLHSLELGRYRLGEGQYFIGGDIPSESPDSFTWGPVLRKEILGKVVLIF